jgi:hypothetical protein
MANTSIEFTNFGDTVFSEGLFLQGDLAVSSSQIQGKGFSELDNQFAVPFLYNQIGQNLPTNIKQSMSGNDPFITVSFKEFVSGFLKCCGTSSCKRFLKPLEKANVCIRNLKDASIMAIFITIIGFVFKLAGMEAPFSIDNSGKIGQFDRIVNFWNIKISVFVIFVNEFFHKFFFHMFTRQYTHETNLIPG